MKKVYETPKLTAISFKAERGYSTSGIVEQMKLIDLEIEGEPNNDRQMEYYTVQDNWHSGGDFWN